MVGFSKYEFYNKLLDGVTLLKVTPGVTWTEPLYIYKPIFLVSRILGCSCKYRHNTKLHKYLFLPFLLLSLILDKIA